MGADMTKNKDGFVDIAIDVPNKAVAAGEYIQGTVHINCKDKREYKLLMIRLESFQEFFWTVRLRRTTEFYRDQKKTYSFAFQLTKFSNQAIASGHYSFPFKFLLPAGFPGSIYQNKQNHIRYPLIAELIPSSGLQDDIQKCFIFLNILQSVRVSLGQITQNQKCTPKGCFGFMEYGAVNVSLSCDKNLVRSDENIFVACYIDNSTGKTEVKNVSIIIKDLGIKVERRGADEKTFSETILGVSPKVVQPGQKQTIEFNVKIPGSNVLAYSTAVGKIFSRYIILQLKANMGCCSNDPSAFVHLVYHSTNPILQKCGPIPKPPAGWNPTVANEVVFSNMMPYNYDPSMEVRIRNRGNTNVNGNKEMMDQSSMGMGGGMEMNQRQPIMNQNVMNMGTQGDMNPKNDFNNMNMGSQFNIMSKNNQQQVQGQKGYTSKYRSREPQYRDNS